MKNRVALLLAALSAVVLSALPAQAVTIGWFGNAASGNPAAAITASGNTPVALAGLTGADLAGISVLWVLNGDNFAAPADLLANASVVAAFVGSGGVLSYHDRYVGEEGFSANNGALPGAAGISFNRDFADDANIQIVNGTTSVTTGLDDDSLDGGTSSSHGYALLGSLPLGAVAVLSQTDLSHIVDFYYPFGSGFVYYSTIPMDYYLGGGGSNPPRANFVDIYAVNEAGFQASLGAVPEPTSLALVALGLVGLAARRRLTQSR